MTDDRTDDLDGTLQGGGAFDWDAALHNAFADLMFSQNHTSIPGAGTPGDTIHAAFEALMFAAAGDSRGAGGAATTWVANDDGAPDGFGRIMFRREAEANASQQLPGVLDVASPQINANTAIASGRAANDNAIWIGSDDGDHLTGVYGRDPSVAVLDNGDALIAWIGADDVVHAHFMPADLHAAGYADTADRAKLDQLLMGLGDAAAAAGGKAGRVTVTALSQNSFAAVWTSDFAIQSVLMGTILTLGTAAHAEDKDDAAATLTWSATDITPVAAPSGVNAIAVDLTDAGAMTVTYTTDDDAQTASDTSSIIHFDTDVTIETVNFVSDDAAGASAVAAPAPRLLPAHHLSIDVAGPEQIVSSGDDNSKSGQSATNGAQHSSDHAPASAHHFSPITATADNGNTFTLAFVDGVLTITQQNADGTPSDAPVIKIPDAIATDPGHPTLDVAPAVTGTDTGVAVVYETQTGSGAETVTTVQIAAFDGGSNPVGGGPVTVATATGPDHSFSDVTTGYTHTDPAPATTTDAAHTDTGTGQSGAETTDGAGVAALPDAALPAADMPTGVLVVAFIADAKPDGFGTLNAQFYAVPDDAGAGHGLIALGEDGQAGGDNDAVFEVTSHDDGGCRAPVIEGLNHGGLAIAWVQQTEHGNGPDVVRGEILTPGEGAAPEVIDLSGLMPEGVAAGSNPVLATDDAGDLIVGWIQAVLTGGFESAAAIYHRINADDGHGHGHWQAPSQATILAKFDNIPRDFAISVSGSGDSLSLHVAWREADNSISTAHFDVDAAQVSQAVNDLQPDNSGHGNNNDGGGLGLSALGDGQVFVVVGSSDDTGTTITTSILQVPQADSGGGANNGQDAPAVIPVSDSGSDRHGSSDSSGSGKDDSSSSSGSDGSGHDTPIAAVTPAPVELAKAPLGSLMAALAQLASDPANDFTAMFTDNSGGSDGGKDDGGKDDGKDSSGSSHVQDNSGHGGGDSGGGDSGGGDSGGGDSGGGDNSGSGSGSCGHGGDNATADAPVLTADVPATPAVSLAAAIINLNSDLIQFVVNAAIADDGAASGAGDPAASDAVATDAAPAPTVHDVAALEAMATPVPDLGNSGSNSGSSSGSEHSGSGGGSSGSGSPDDGLSSALVMDDHSGGSGSSGSGGHSGSGSSGGSSSGGGHDSGGDSGNLNTSANDNSPAGTFDHPMTFAAGYGNDISDYVSPEEQAALIPEPISVLFEALQFANAFNDTANSDVMMFDTSNVVTISQFDSSGHGGGHSHDTPFG
jgi:hypothetical protein